MDILYEIFISGVKDWSTQLISGILIGITVWIFPKLRRILRKSLSDLFSTGWAWNKSATPQSETFSEPLDDVDDDFEPDFEDDNAGEASPEWVHERLQEDKQADGCAIILAGFVAMMGAGFWMAEIRKGQSIILPIILITWGILIFLTGIYFASRKPNLIDATEKGRITVQNKLGERYELNKSYHLAYMWRYLAGLCGDETAAEKLKKVSSNMSPAGIASAKEEALKIFKSIQEKRQQAMKYYRAAASRGDTTAQYNLGYVYQHGDSIIGVEQDNYLSYVWYYVAVLGGSREAKSRITKLEDIIFPTQMCQAQIEAKKRFARIQARKYA